VPFPVSVTCGTIRYAKNIATSANAIKKGSVRDLSASTRFLPFPLRAFRLNSDHPRDEPDLPSALTFVSFARSPPRHRALDAFWVSNVSDRLAGEWSTVAEQQSSNSLYSHLRPRHATV
jgi:hypothetical protein